VAMKSPFIAFDLEGPLIKNDSITELTGLFKGGDILSRVLNRYKELLIIAGQESGESASIATLVIPFLITHGITLENIYVLADKAEIVPGAKEVIAGLKSKGWQVHCVTTAYLPYARRLGERLGLEPQNIWGTVLPLDYYEKKVTKTTRGIIRRTEQAVTAFEPYHADRQIKEKLDRLFSNSRWGLGWLTQEMSPMGGRRKLLILRTFALAQRFSLKEVVVVGDSNDDVPMLKAVNKSGGLAIGFNANHEALSQATIGLASTNILDILPVLDAWAKGGRESAFSVIREKAGIFGASERDNIHIVEPNTLPIDLHTRLRRVARSKAVE